MLVLFTIICFVTVVLLIVCYTLAMGIGPSPTSGRIVRKLLTMIPPETLHFYDLGSGWGTVALAVSRRFPNCQISGYERSPLPWICSRLRASLRRRKNLALTYANIFDQPFKGDSVYFCYLYRGAMQRLAEKIKAEAPTNVTIISHTFALPGFSPCHVQRVNDIYETPIYVYRT